MASSGLAPGFSGAAAALHADHVAAFAAGDFDVIGLLQLLHEIGERAGAVGLLVERGIELQHGGFQQAELRAHLAPFQHAEGALHQRHGLRQVERHPLVRRPLLLLLLRLLLLRLLRRLLRAAALLRIAAAGCCCLRRLLLLVAAASAARSSMMDS